MILVLNCGSQSIKWKLFDDNLKLKKEETIKVLQAKDYRIFLENELTRLKDYQKDIKVIGHRVVHGGGRFSKPIKINLQNLKELEKYDELAPLHNPFNIIGIKMCQKIFGEIPSFAIFDTEFYASLSEKAYTYALPEKIRQENGFRRFGFHGISHEYAEKEGAKIIGKQFKNLKIISCHLGGGASITATKFGKAIDTSMGFSPLEGLVMMTRSGSIDPEIILKMCKHFSAERVSEILNHDSGIKGICGEKDMLAVLKKIKKGDKKAKLALDIFCYSIKKYIGSYFAILGGCDLLVFTGAIGFGSSKIRNMICRDLAILRSTKVIAVKPSEELAIARKVLNIKN